MEHVQYLKENMQKRSIPLSEPVISGNEWKYVKDCLDTGWVSSVGKYVDLFENNIASYCGAQHGIATVNGTSALHISLLVCGVKQGDEVIVPTLTFVAPVNAVKYCNAEPVFMDCDPNTLCMDINKVTDFLRNECEKRTDGFTYNKKTQRRIKAIAPVHIFGHPVDMDPLMVIAKEHNISVIEDATESLGSKYKDKKTGSIGDIGCFSFNGNKIITAGGGGMIVTNDDEKAHHAKHLTTQAKSDSLTSDHDQIGYNYRLTNIQAAMGIAQLEKLDDIVEVKRKNAMLYKELLSDSDVIEVLCEKTWSLSNFWLNTIKVGQKHKRPLLDYLIQNDIHARPIWKLIHTLPMYKSNESYNITNALEVSEQCINLPSSVGIKNEDIEYVTKTIKKYLSN
ncbi:MAG: LegC family aminotransferase [Candidatus Ancaeobacter aquaticus]|nr:LegC family aminotransferase [Candidatus Ancaeobacter aquaticus]